MAMTANEKQLAYHRHELNRLRLNGAPEWHKNRHRGEILRLSAALTTGQKQHMLEFLSLPHVLEEFAKHISEAVDVTHLDGADVADNIIDSLYKEVKSNAEHE